ncbi:hypothetical protein [Nannocystis pusilla]|uniref:hypothetical protein n=1 Tax=Nannocystis pusilla TaxID=889268 RepID=UPI003DA555CE
MAEGLRDAGLHEHVAMAFVAESKIEFFTVPPERRVRVENPMRAAGVMRTHMLPGLLDALTHNIARHTRPVRLFEVGRTYAWPERHVPKDGPTAAIDVLLPRERAVAAALIYGGAKGGASAREITGAAVQALARVGLRARPVDPTAPVAHLHPGVQAALAVDGAVVGEAGEVHPDLVRAWDLPEGTRVYYAEIDIEAVPPRVTATARDLPRFPSTARDLSLEIPLTVSAARVVAALTAAAGQVDRSAVEASQRAGGKTTAGEVRLATDSFGEPAVEVLEDYRGAGVPVGHRALLLRLHYAAEQRSVTDDEAQALHNAIVAAACESLRASAPTVRPR